MLAKLAELDTEQAKAVAGGGEKYVERHHAAASCRPRADQAAHRRGIGLLRALPARRLGIGLPRRRQRRHRHRVVEGVECMITANDPTVKGGASTPNGRSKKIFRARRSPRRTGSRRSPRRVGGADLPAEGDLHPGGAALPRHHAGVGARKEPTVAVVAGNSTAGGAYVPGMSDYRDHGQGSRPRSSSAAHRW